MTSIRSALIAAFKDLDKRLRDQAQLPAPSRRTLLDPSTTLLAGDLALVGARRDADAELVLSIIALDAAYARDVLLVVQDEWWAQVLLLSIAADISTDVASDAIAGLSITDEQRARVDKAMRIMRSQPLEISGSVRYSGAPDLLERWFEHHPGGLAVLPAAWPASLGGDEEAAAAFVREMKTIARTHDGAILIPWRVGDRHRLDRRPQLHDLAVSGAAEADADLVLLFHSSEYGVEIFVAKNRHRAPGYIYESPSLDQSP
jgi:hypothetical protein